MRKVVYCGKGAPSGWAGLVSGRKPPQPAPAPSIISCIDPPSPHSYPPDICPAIVHPHPRSGICRKFVIEDRERICRQTKTDELVAQSKHASYATRKRSDAISMMCMERCVRLARKTDMSVCLGKENESDSRSAHLHLQQARRGSRRSMRTPCPREATRTSPRQTW